MKLDMPEEFFTERLGMFRLRHEDAEEIFYTYASKPEATKYVSWATHETLRDTRSYLVVSRRGWEAGVDYSFAIRLQGRRLIGSCGVINDNGSIQFGYILSPSQWGNGYATEMCCKLMEIVSGLPGVNSVGTFVDADNVASIRVLEKSGLKLVERREQWFRFVNQGQALKDCLVFRFPMPAQAEGK
ncbi:MAG: GNAT family N-acetyltransferase [Cyclobacteriaceae bacterium]|nr:GNAT family N-acetyltransferase [Cyclobacteriaceae bacterium]